MGRRFGAGYTEVRSALRSLADYHGVVLHPSSDEVWVVHPFSLAPTNYWLESASGSWWSNCVWCSLGAAHLLKRDLTITTNLGGESKQVTIRIVDGRIERAQPAARDGLLVHFPVPMIKSWDNVVFTCSVMCLFDSRAAVDDWCARHNIVPGDVQPLETVFQFAKKWYGNHLHPDWKKWTASQAKGLFREFGLTGRIWEIPEAEARF